MDNPTSEFEALDAVAVRRRTAPQCRSGPTVVLRIAVRLGRCWQVVLACLTCLSGYLAQTIASESFGPPQLVRPVHIDSLPTLPPSPALIQRLPSTTPVVNADQYLDLSGPAAGDYLQGSWQWRYLPSSIIYHSYMASVHEPRLSGIVFGDLEDSALLDATLGGRVGLLRYGSVDDLRPEGWQLDLEGASFPRLGLDHNWDVEAVDFRVGLPLTYGIENWQYKFSYYHLSSHLGDEFAIRNPGSLGSRINYSRDAFVLGVSWYPQPAWRLYAEADWAFHFDDGNLPWEFLFGIDYAQPGPTGYYGTPFIAAGGHLREAVDFGGNFVAQAGWLWRGITGHTLRIGAHYYNGKSSQFEFFDEFEQQIGFGVWYDQ